MGDRKSIVRWTAAGVVVLVVVLASAALVTSWRASRTFATLLASGKSVQGHDPEGTIWQEIEYAGPESIVVDTRSFSVDLNGIPALVFGFDVSDRTSLAARHVRLDIYSDLRRGGWRYLASYGKSVGD